MSLAIKRATGIDFNLYMATSNTQKDHNYRSFCFIHHPVFKGHLKELFNAYKLPTVNAARINPFQIEAHLLFNHG